MMTAQRKKRCTDFFFFSFFAIGSPIFSSFSSPLSLFLSSPLSLFLSSPLSLFLSSPLSLFLSSPLSLFFSSPLSLFLFFSSFPLPFLLLFPSSFLLLFPSSFLLLFPSSFSSPLSLFLSSPLSLFLSSPLSLFLSSPLSLFLSSPLSLFLSSPLSLFLSSPLSRFLSSPLSLFLSSPLSLFLSSPLYHTSFAPSHFIWSRFGCTSKIGFEKGFLKDENLHFFQTLEASNELPVNVGQLIFIPCIVCMPYPMGSKHQTLLHSCRREGRLKIVWHQLRINTLWQWKGYVPAKKNVVEYSLNGSCFFFLSFWQENFEKESCYCWFLNNNFHSAFFFCRL